MLHTFPAGEGIAGGLIQGTDGLLYGTSYVVSGCPKQGSIYSLTLAGGFQTIYSFLGYLPGRGPLGALTEASDGFFYGTTNGGASGYGNLFRLLPDGSQHTNLVQFNFQDGAVPGSDGPSVVQGSDGAIYGTTTSGGGVGKYGTVYRYNAGAPPPLPDVRYFQPISGAVGSAVLIRGDHLLALSSVSFNGAPASKILSRSTDFAVAYVPAGATSGPITVTTANGSKSTKSSFNVE